MEVAFDTPVKRGKLAARRSPYFVSIGGSRGGVSLGYRRHLRGAGSWIAKLVHDGRRSEARLGEADDAGAGPEAVTYRKAVAAAIDWAEQQKAAQDEAPRGRKAATRTVKSAIEDYLAFRERKPAGARDARSRLELHVLKDEEFAATPLAKLRAEKIDRWRSALPAELAPSTVNRLLNDARAALNSAAERFRRELPATLPLEIKVGTRALPAAGTPRMQVLADQHVQRLVQAAAQIDPEFHHLILTLAATGARFSQVAALRVGDLQVAAGRIMVRPSGKGRGNKARPLIPIALASEVIATLAPLISDRPASAPLLTTGDYVRETQGTRIAWRRVGTREWRSASEGQRRWAQAVAIAELPPSTVPYALRHSSIVRGLKAGLPVRLVAALHDTSIAMIEAHYAAYIVDAAEMLARNSLFRPV